MASSDQDDGPSRSPTPDESGGEEPSGDMSEQKQSEKKPTNGTSNVKDPNRPRRKKARRACFACQRAHLTCGDERPCQRCIKRGLQDACQDGVRKKAKYLHDAPNEALMPGVGASMYTHPQAKRNSSTTHSGSPTHQQSSQPTSQPQSFFPQSNYAMFNTPSAMPPPILHGRAMNSSSFQQPSPITPGFNPTDPLQSPDATNGSSMPTQWSSSMFDDPSMFNFDISSMNFGNHYGALEFGMLGQMAGNAGETPPSESGTQRGSVHNPYRMPMGSFSESPQNSFANYNNDALMSDWSNGSAMFNQMQGPPAFTIESNAQFHSPESHTTPPDALKFEDSPLLTGSALKPPMSNMSGGPVQQPPNNTPPQKQRQPTQISTPQLKAQKQIPAKTTKRARDPSAIYTTVTMPHPYTTNFHALISYLQKRFASHPSKTLAIAKCLASIRPSFIATTKTLSRDDLIFMEKCFQRTLFEYEGFIEGVGTPTIVARRTGEIAAVGKEFQILTGWTKNILLGRAPNLNVNRGHTGQTPGEGSGANTGNRNTGWNTPRGDPTATDGEKKDKPVFLAELLDDDSVVQFYEDFARLAFGDSRGSVFRKGKLLKYRTKDDEIASNLQREADSRSSRDGGDPMDVDRERRPTSGGHSSDGVKKEGISSQKGMQKLGTADGKVDCAYCWTVKRDVFDIPMLIVMNFLPCI